MRLYSVRDLISHQMLWSGGCLVGNDCKAEKEQQLSKDLDAAFANVMAGRKP
jgi:hypothetical protein